MHRGKSHASRRSQALQEKIHASREKIHTSRERDSLRFAYQKKIDIGYIIFLCNNDIKRTINILHQPIFITLTSKEEYIEDYIANMRHKLYFLYIKPDEVDVTCSRRAIKCQHGKRHCLPFELHFYANEFISVFVGSIQEDEFSKQTTGADDIN